MVSFLGTGICGIASKDLFNVTGIPLLSFVLIASASVLLSFKEVVAVGVECSESDCR